MLRGHPLLTSHFNFFIYFAPIAQLDRAPVFGTVGWGFKSLLGHMKLVKFFIFIFLSLAWFQHAKPCLAEELQAKVLQANQNFLKVQIISQGKFHNQTITIPNSKIQSTNFSQYHTGDTIILQQTQNANHENIFIPTDFVRLNALSWLFLLFILTVILVTKWQGLSSLLGMVASFFIIFKLILPLIMAGKDPILASLAGAVFIIPTTFYLSHGFNRKTSLAIAGTLISLAIIGILARIFVVQAKISGFANEEISFLQLSNPHLIQVTSLLIAAIIIGALGVLDDVTVSQASIVERLKRVSPRLSFKELYQQSMIVGRDHISSMVNTLILVYAGASLPLLLLFINNPKPITQILNYEIIAEEIVRTLVGSIGLILAIPITNFLATFSFTRKPPKA